MKPILLTALAGMYALVTFAQTDTTKADTLKAGGFVIIKKPNNNNGNPKNSISVNFNTQNKTTATKNLSTNWWIVDVGFANYRDETNYTQAQQGNYLTVLNANAGAVDKNSMRLNTGKSSNVNIWIFMQKLNITKHVLNLKYGLGLEMYNFRYDRNISYRKNPNAIVFNDTVSFSKNKLYAGYITIPFMLNVNTKPNSKNALSFSAGVSAGYLIGSRNKQVSNERGKVKYRGNFDLEPFRLAAIGEIGLGPVRIYGSYSLNALHEKSTQLSQYPYAIGVRFSNW